MTTRWALQWRSENKLDGKRTWIMWENCFPLLFLTRNKARQYANEKYGYIKSREDLRREPHGWKFPKAVKVEVVLKPKLREGK